MISRQTEQLLIDRRKLLNDLGELCSARLAQHCQLAPLACPASVHRQQRLRHERSHACNHLSAEQCCRGGPCATLMLLAAPAGSKDEAVRGLEAGLHHLSHQLELALADRQLLLSELCKVADGSEVAALAAALEEGRGGDSGDGGDEEDEAGGEQQQQQQLEAAAAQ